MGVFDDHVSVSRILLVMMRYRQPRAWLSLVHGLGLGLELGDNMSMSRTLK